MWFEDDAMVRRLESGVDRTGPGCHEWTKGKCQGYGRIRVGNTVGYAHRMSMEIQIGRALLPGECVLHSCDNTACVRFDHLRIGTNADNIRDRTERCRGVWGERHRSARLKAQDVREIRALLDVGTLQADLATRYGVSNVAISNIKRRATWRNLV